MQSQIIAPSGCYQLQAPQTLPKNLHKTTSVEKEKQHPLTDGLRTYSTSAGPITEALGISLFPPTTGTQALRKR